MAPLNRNIVGLIVLAIVVAAFAIAAATIGDTVVFAAPGDQTFVLVGEDGAPACGADPCDGIFCVLQGEPAAACACP